MFVLYQDSTFGDEGGISSWDMAARVLGRLEEFNPESDLITKYVERAGIYFEANEVPADKKVPRVPQCCRRENLHTFAQPAVTDSASRQIV